MGAATASCPMRISRRTPRRINCGNAPFAATRGGLVGGDFSSRPGAVVWVGRDGRPAGDESRGGHAAAGDAAFFLREPAISGGARGAVGGNGSENGNGAAYGFHSAGPLWAIP